MVVVWSDLAFESLADIIEYVQGFFGRKTALETSEKIVSFTDSLGESPHLGKRITHLLKYGDVRRAVFKQNHIYYQVWDDRVEIVIVWDCRQDPLRLKHLLTDFLSRRE